ncbi:MAG TPA: RsmD family RNA methyltransferase [Nitrososphaerales archaeon]|nr:RsmD family RNA methyltransferase [Nitrososphaerales archaeon]
MKNKTLVLLSGEGTSVPMAEAKALFLAYDGRSSFEVPEPKVLIADSAADPFVVGARIAFARRVGPMFVDAAEAHDILRGCRVRFRCFDLVDGLAPPDPEKYLRGIDAVVDLRNPERELTLVRGEREYLSVSAPLSMKQGWSHRRPRSRPFFHPSAIFPKLSRALVNLSRCREGESFLDPFAGTGSLAIEASIVGAKVLAMDLSEKMTKGSLANMKHFGQDWLGVMRVDSAVSPITQVDAIATDIPYGRASSTRGRRTQEIIDLALISLSNVLKKGSVLVLMHPQTVGVKSTSELKVEEEHNLHVHKRLMRTITVLRRR